MANQLEIIVKESGLEQTKAQVILTKFQDYFDLASKWEQKAKTILVTDEKQTSDMKMARIGRLELREKRLAIENTRKELKEQSLREGKAIDGIANVLKALIVPIEDYLEKQEKFVEIRLTERTEQLRLEAEKKIEEERIAKEKFEAEEREKMRLENEKLRKEAQEKAFAEAEKIRKENAIKLEEERAKTEAIRKEAELQAEILRNQIECPNCHHKFQIKKGL